MVYFKRAEFWHRTGSRALRLYSYPKPAVDVREPQPFHRTAEDGELLPKSDIVESQLATSLEGGDESANKRRNQAGMVPADRRLIKFGAPG